MIATLAATLLMIPAGEASSTDWTACASDEGESSIACVWDSKHMGNGLGHSFKINNKNVVTLISHRKAERLLGW